MAITQIPFPKNAQKRITWIEDGKKGWAYIIVGYCPDNISHFLRLCNELKKDIPELNEDKILCSKVTNSNTIKNFTIVVGFLDFEKRKIPGYVEWESMDFNY